MREWHDLPQKDGDYYYLKVVDIYRDDALFVDYEIYKNECEEPIQIDFFQEAIEKIIQQVKEDYREMERNDVLP
jgi:hypothetical protein